MTHLERVQAALCHEQPDRTPYTAPRAVPPNLSSFHTKCML